MATPETLFPVTVTLKDGTPVRQRALGDYEGGHGGAGGYLLDFRAGAGGDGSNGANAGILFVTFENRASERTRDDRLSWGFPFLRDEGFSVLGVKARRADWYRDPAIAAFFESADFAAFAATFRRVVFYGGSMGGTGALALATPGADVLAISPQVTLDPHLTPWETRYDESRVFDWSGPYQAVAGAARARTVYAVYDPFDPLDPKHIALLPPATLRPLKLPFMGHGVPDWVTHTDLLKDLVRLVAADGLTVAAWQGLARRRRLTPDYAYRMRALRRTPCVERMCLIEGLKRWCQMADNDPQNLNLQVHVLNLLTQHKQAQASQVIAQRVQRLLAEKGVEL